MSTLPIPTQKIVFNTSDATLRANKHGSFSFANRLERAAMAKLALPSLLHLNGIKARASLNPYHRLRLCDPSDKQQLLTVGTVFEHNRNHIEQAITANKKEQAELFATIAKQESLLPSSKRLHQRMTHLTQENKQLGCFGNQLTSREHLLGFVGDSSSAIIQFQGDELKSFGSHSFGIVQDTRSGAIKLIPVETDQLNRRHTNSKGKSGGTDGLAFMYRTRDFKVHKENLALKEAEEQVTPKQSHFYEKLFGTKQIQTTGAESAGAACCSITSLDELANVGQRTDHDHGEIIVPKNAGEGALTGFVTYASAGGIKIAADIYANFNAITKEITIAQKTASLYRLENQAILDQPQNQELKRAADACDTFLAKQKTEARFQKRVAGILSGFGSLSILVGQFVAKVSPVGLYLLSAFGAGHIIRMGQQLHQTCKDYQRADPANHEKHHFYKKMKNLSLALIGWSLYTAGTATLGTMSLGMMGIMITTGLAPALTIAGIAALGVGIAGSVVYNNIISSKRFYPGAPMLSRLDVRNPPTQTQIDQKIAQAKALRDISKQYRAKTFTKQHTSAPGAVAKHTALRYANKAALYATLGLHPAPFMKNKFKIKGQRTKAIDHTDPVQNRARLDAMGQLFEMERTANPKLRKSGTLTFSESEFNAAKSVLLNTPPPKVPTRQQRLDSLNRVFDVLESIPKSDQIMKMFAKKVLTEHSQLRRKQSTPLKNTETDNPTRSQEHGFIGQFIPNIETTTWIKPEYESLFTSDALVNKMPPTSSLKDAPQEYDTGASDRTKIVSYKPLEPDAVSALGSLLRTRPCCGAHGAATGPYQGLTFFLRQLYNETEEKNESQIQKLEDTLYESIDQYLLYQARNNAKEDVALYSNYKMAFDYPSFSDNM